MSAKKNSASDSPLLLSTLNRIEDNILKTQEHMSQLSVTLAEQHITLKDHIRRTEQNEEAIASLVTDTQQLQKDRDKVVVVGKAAAALAVVGAGASKLTAFQQFFHWMGF